MIWTKQRHSTLLQSSRSLVMMFWVLKPVRPIKIPPACQEGYFECQVSMQTFSDGCGKSRTGPWWLPGKLGLVHIWFAGHWVGDLVFGWLWHCAMKDTADCFGRAWLKTPSTVDRKMSPFSPDLDWGFPLPLRKSALELPNIYRQHRWIFVDMLMEGHWCKHWRDMGTACPHVSSMFTSMTFHQHVHENRTALSPVGDHFSEFSRS